MTQPEETTAALIARLHEQNRIANMELARLTHIGAQESAECDRLKHERDRLKHERDASFAATSKAQDERDQARADLATVDRMLVERTRERDEARERIARALVREEGLIRTEAAVIKERDRALKERDEAREQLAKLEWVPRRNGRECPICHSYEESGSHRPTCWFAKQKAAPGVNTWRNHRQDCPARTADDVAWVDSRWQVNGCQAAPMEGLRPKPIGCDGCKCEKPPTLREQWKAKQATYDHWMDACGYMLMGVDFAGGNTVTVKTGRPVQPGASFAYDQSSGIWMLVDKQLAKELARPEPRFKVGERAWAHGKTHTIESSLWHALFSFWSHRMEDGETVSDHDLKPAPKFAVGEWVMFLADSGEIQKREWGHGLWGKEEWVYGLVLNGQNWRLGESDLTAQTPQHKHDCKGCVFLGRMDAGDLYWTTTHYRDPGLLMVGRFGQQSFWPSYSNSTGPEFIEARRRAVARGLVKS